MLYDSGRDDGPVMEARFSTRDGDLVAFDGWSGDVINIFVVGADGKGLRQLTHSTGGAPAAGAGAFRPRWFPGADTHILYFDSADASMYIVPSGTLDVDPTPRRLWTGRDFEWTTVPGELPPAVATPTMIDTPVVPTQTPAPPPVTPDESGLLPPDAGSGAAAARGRGRLWLPMALAASGAAFLAGAAVRARARRR
jgi:hypothetical protein